MRASTVTVKETRYACVRVTAGESAPEQYAAAELIKYLKKMGVPEGEGGLTIRLAVAPSIGRDGYRLTVDDGMLLLVFQQCFRFFNRFGARRAVSVALREQQRLVDLGNIAINGTALCRQATLLQVTDNFVCGNNVVRVRVTHQIFIDQIWFHLLVRLFSMCHALHRPLFISF